VSCLYKINSCPLSLIYYMYTAQPQMLLFVHLTTGEIILVLTLSVWFGFCTYTVEIILVLTLSVWFGFCICTLEIILVLTLSVWFGFCICTLEMILVLTIICLVRFLYIHIRDNFGSYNYLFGLVSVYTAWQYLQCSPLHW
jgi:hypothetical protein